MSQGKHIALIIGVDTAPDSGRAPLLYAEASARALAEQLASSACGFELYGDAPLLGGHATTEQVRKAIAQLMGGLGANDTLLLAFIGHGRWMQIEAERQDVYLVTSSFSPADVVHDENTHISMRWLQDKVLRQSGPGQILLLLDCCYGGAIGEAQPDHYLEELHHRLEQYFNVQSVSDPSTGARLRKVLTAVSANRESFEQDGTTVYTGMLVRGLAGEACENDGLVTWLSLHQFALRELRQLQPGEYGFGSGTNLVLATHPKPPGMQVGRQPWMVPYGANPQFIGRDSEVAHLAEVLLPASMERPAVAAVLPALAGVGGIGKTQLAIEFAHRYRDQFPGGVFWLNMERAETIEAQVVTCGGQTGLGLFDDDEDTKYAQRISEWSITARFTSSISQQHTSQDLKIEDQLDKSTDEMLIEPRLTFAERAQRVIQAWEEPIARLLIFDNLEDERLLRRWRPRAGGSRVLITTRNQTWSLLDGVQTVALDPLADQASLTLLLGQRAIARYQSVEVLLSGHDERHAAEELIELLGRLPLALILAGSFLADRSISIREYVQRIQRSPIRDSSLNTELRQMLPSGHEPSIYATFAISYEGLKLDDPRDERARTMWLVASQLAPQPIPADLLMIGCGLDPFIADQREQGDRALVRLRQLGLLEAIEKNFKLHRLLASYAREVTYDQQIDRQRAKEACLATEVAWKNSDDSPAEALLNEHIHYLASTLEGRGDDRAAKLLASTASLAFNQDDYLLARTIYIRILAIEKDIYGDVHESVANTLWHLGCVACQEGDYASARQYFTKALSINEQTVGWVHTTTATTLRGLGLVAQEEGDYAGARQYYAESLAIIEQMVGRVNASTASTLFMMGRATEEEGDYVSAREYYTEALDINKQTLASIQHSTDMNLYYLDIVDRVADDPTMARQHFIKALSFNEQTVGRVHASTAETLQVLGRVAQGEGNYASARQYYAEALSINEQTVGRVHARTATTLFLLGLVAEGEGTYVSAREYLTEALAINEQTVGWVHASTATMLCALGLVAQEEGDYVSARQYYTEALSINEQTVGRVHASTATTLCALGRAAQEEGDYVSARQYYTQELAINEQTVGWVHASTATTLFFLGSIEISESRYRKAHYWLKASLDIKKSILKKDDPSIGTTRNALHRVWFDLWFRPAYILLTGLTIGINLMVAVVLLAIVVPLNYYSWLFARIMHWMLWFSIGVFHSGLLLQVLDVTLSSIARLSILLVGGILGFLYTIFVRQPFIRGIQRILRQRLKSNK